MNHRSKRRRRRRRKGFFTCKRNVPFVFPHSHSLYLGHRFNFFFWFVKGKMLRQTMMSVCLCVIPEVCLIFHEPFYRLIEIRQFQIANQFMTSKFIVNIRVAFRVCAVFFVSFFKSQSSILSYFTFIAIAPLRSHSINKHKRAYIFCVNLWFHSLAAQYSHTLDFLNEIAFYDFPYSIVNAGCYHYKEGNTRPRANTHTITYISLHSTAQTLYEHCCHFINEN